MRGRFGSRSTAVAGLAVVGLLSWTMVLGTPQSSASDAQNLTETTPADTTSAQPAQANAQPARATADVGDGLPPLDAPEDVVGEGVLVHGEVEAVGDGYLTVRIPEATTETHPDGSVSETRLVLPVLGDVSGTALVVEVTPETELLLLVGDLASVEVGTPVLVAATMEGTTLVADVVVDSRSTVIDAQEPDDPPEVGAAVLAEEPGDPPAVLPQVGTGEEPQPATLPPCSETEDNEFPCTASFPGEVGLDLTWDSPAWNQTFIHLGALKAVFHSMRAQYRFGGQYEFPFEFDLDAGPGLVWGEERPVSLSVEPVGLPWPQYTYDTGLYAGVDLNFRFCNWNLFKWRWSCKNYTHSIGFGFRMTSQDAAPMAGEILETEPASCVGVDLLDFLPKSVAGFGTAGIEACFNVTIHGTDLNYRASIYGVSTPLAHPAGTVPVSPRGPNVGGWLSGFRYRPTADIDFSLDIYLFKWRKSLFSVDYAEADFNAIPTGQDDCPFLGLFPLSFFLMFTVTCGEQPEALPFTLPADAAKLAVTVEEVGAAAPGATHAVEVDGPGDHDMVVEVAAGDTWTSGWLPMGDYTLTELDPPTIVTYAPDRTVTLAEDGEVVTATITNDHSAGRLAVEVLETGDTAPGATYTVAVDGPGDADFAVDVAAGETWTSDWLPLGDYTVVQSDEVDGTTYDPGRSVTLAEDGEVVAVTVTNPYGDAEDEDDDGTDDDGTDDDGTDDDGTGGDDASGTTGTGGTTSVASSELAFTGSALAGVLLAALLLIGTGRLALRGSRRRSA